MSVKGKIAEESIRFQTSNYKVPKAVYLSRDQYIHLLKEEVPTTGFSHVPEPGGDSSLSIFGMEIRIGTPMCHCGEEWNEGHRCLPSLVNGPPPLIRIV